MSGLRSRRVVGEMNRVLRSREQRQADGITGWV
jgi:hypothetical protein